MPVSAYLQIQKKLKSKHFTSNCVLRKPSSLGLTANLRKHAVDFAEAATVFGDPLSITVRDPDHSEVEDRFIIVGYSNQFRPLLVSHIDQGGRVRIISARQLTRAERRDYEKEKQK